LKEYPEVYEYEDMEAVNAVVQANANAIEFMDYVDPVSNEYKRVKKSQFQLNWLLFEDM
jgi:hypothetical protein